MHTRNAASVLPEPVGAAISVWLPAAISRQPSAWGVVGPAGNRRANQVRDHGMERVEHLVTVTQPTDNPPGSDPRACTSGQEFR